MGMTKAEPQPVLRCLTIAWAFGWAAGCGEEPTRPPSNQPPIPVGSIPAVSFFLGDSAKVPVSGYFNDPDGDALSYTAASSDEGITIATTSADTVWVVPAGKGEATVTVTATDSEGLSAQQSLAVTVVNRPPEPVGSVPAVETAVRDSAIFRVSEYFSDPDGDSLSYTAASSDEEIVTAGVSGDTVRVVAVGQGEATVTVTATDTEGLSAEQSVRVTVAPDPQRAILAALYESTGGVEWTHNDNWLTDADLDTWYGVGVDERGAVGVLDLRGNELRGAIPSELGKLSSLASLHLGDNQLEGRVPAELGELSGIGYLNLAGNRLEGSIPVELGGLSRLRNLLLERNHLEGIIPTEIGGLAGLRYLDLSENRLEGTLPPELGQLSELRHLYLSNNQLEGPLPSSFLQLESMSGLRIHRNPSLCAPGSTAFLAWLDGFIANRVWAPLCNEADRIVLETLHRATAGSEWTESGGWLDARDLNDWYGVRTDTLGLVAAISLADNGLRGKLPIELGGLSALSDLDVGGNALRGPLPSSMTALSLDRLRYVGTRLCAPVEGSFREWLDGIGSHEGTGVECPDSRKVLEELYEATDGSNWNRRDNWLTDAPLEQWYGVRTDEYGQVTELRLYRNNLVGQIPARLGQLAYLEFLQLNWNRLTGGIPPELGALSSLRYLNLGWTSLTGGIPAELGNLFALEHLYLGFTGVRGVIPPEFGNLSSLRSLDMNASGLTGSIPPELGGLPALEGLFLERNELTGGIPPELGNLSELVVLFLEGNQLHGPIPPELGNLSRLRFLRLSRNNLSGAVPAELSGLRPLVELHLAHNPALSGELPSSLSALTVLEELLVGETGLCAPAESLFRRWLDGVRLHRVKMCGQEPSAAYLVQAVQSRDYPVPLVAGREALLRVFVTSSHATDAGMPPVRARFYLDGSERHTVTIPGKSTAIPTEVDEGSLVKSANALIPPEVVQPGLEMVIEVDPEETLDAELGVVRRIPAEGRSTIEVRTMPTLDLTVIPFLWEEDPDSLILEITEDMAQQEEEHELLQLTYDLLPVEDFRVSRHDPVESSTNNAIDLFRQVYAIAAMEGGTGHYQGLMSGKVTGAAGVAAGRASFAKPRAETIAHELGHNLGLGHAPCGALLFFPDLSFPHTDGEIGTWGYDFRAEQLVPPETPDVMSYCRPSWISEYHFSNALRHRVASGQAARHASSAPTEAILLWGGLDEDGNPFLEPAFIVEAAPSLPGSPGSHELTGRDHRGTDLFKLSFDMVEIADAEGEAAAFAFTLPVDENWAGSMASITLSGPDGSVTLDQDTDEAKTIVRDPRSGQVRAIWNGAPGSVARWAGLRVLQSRGVPALKEWERR